MIEEPRRFLREFVEAGAGIMTVHAEAVRHLHATVAAIQDAGSRPARPESGHAALGRRGDRRSAGPAADHDGQSRLAARRLIPETLDKIARARALLDARGARAELEVDGGVKAENVGEVVRRGARVVVPARRSSWAAEHPRQHGRAARRDRPRHRRPHGPQADDSTVVAGLRLRKALPGPTARALGSGSSPIRTPPSTR